VGEKGKSRDNKEIVDGKNHRHNMWTFTCCVSICYMVLGDCMKPVYHVDERRHRPSIQTVTGKVLVDFPKGTSAELPRTSLHDLSFIPISSPSPPSLPSFLPPTQHQHRQSDLPAMLRAGETPNSGEKKGKDKRFQCSICQRLFARLEHLQVT